MTLAAVSNLAAVALIVATPTLVVWMVCRAVQADRRRREFFAALHEQAKAAAGDGHPRISYRISGELDHDRGEHPEAWRGEDGT